MLEKVNIKPGELQLRDAAKGNACCLEDIRKVLPWLNSVLPNYEA